MCVLVCARQLAPVGTCMILELRLIIACVCVFAIFCVFVCLCACVRVSVSNRRHMILELRLIIVVCAGFWISSQARDPADHARPVRDVRDVIDAWRSCGLRGVDVRDRLQGVHT